MTRINSLFAVLVLTAFSLGVQSASAQDTVHFLAAGSSAMWQGVGLAAANDLAPGTVEAGGDNPGGSIHHWTYKSACPGSTCITVLHDPRTNSGTGAIPNEPSNLWIVWTCPPAGCNGTTQKAVDIWAYHQVDSTVGVRSFMSRPNGCGSPCNVSAVESLVTNDVEGPNPAYAGVNAISPSLFIAGSGVPSWGGGDTSCGGGATTCDDEFVPADVWAAISGAGGVALNTGMTDIRPEDAKAATKRANGPATNNVSLGYGTVGSQLIGSPIQSSYSATNANPVEFGMPGLPDPFNNVTVPSTITVIPVGEEPIVFIVNRSNPAGLGAPDITTGGPFAFTDLEDGAGPIAGTPANPNPLSALFSGYDCSGENATFYDDAAAPNASLAAAGVGNFATVNIQREALSGTMNTTEWSVFRTNNLISSSQINALYPHIANAANGSSQEYNINASTQNPLNTGCEKVNGVQGIRRRAVGTGELVNTGVKGTADSIGYTFFSFGNVSKIQKAANYGYLTLDEVDPIFASYTGSEPGQPGNGELPGCTPPGCNTSSIWNNPAGSFPNLRNGKYRAWSLLRALCDTAVTTCETDPLGTKALITSLQNDIVNPISPTAVADFLPYSQATYVRAHYNIIPGAEHADPFAYYFDQPPVGTAQTLTLDVASTAPGAEQGGDAGGCIVPVNVALDGGSNANDTTLYITAVTAETGTTTTFSYTNVSGTPLKTLFGYGHPTTISVWGFPAANNNGTFKINAVGGAAVTVNNGGAVGTVQSIPGSGSGAPNGSAGNGSAAGSADTTCYQ
jgi:hypothetical protein